MRIRLLTPLISALMLMVPASAGAVGWVTGTPLSAPGRVAVEPKVAVTPTGERVVAWQEFRAGTSDIEDTVVRIAAPGGGFGAQQTFPTGNGEDLSLASGSDGTVALVWSDSTSSSGADLHIARQTPGQPGFTEATPLPLGTFTSDAPHVAVQNGDVYVALDTSRFDGNVKTTTVRVVRLAAGSGQIQPVNGPAGPNLDQASFNTSNQPSTIVDGSQIAVEGGTVHVAWERLQDAAAGTTTSTTLVRRATAAAGARPLRRDRSRRLFDDHLHPGGVRRSIARGGPRTRRPGVAAVQRPADRLPGADVRRRDPAHRHVGDESPRRNRLGRRARARMAGIHRDRRRRSRVRRHRAARRPGRAAWRG